LRDWCSAVGHYSRYPGCTNVTYRVFKRTPQIFENYLLCLQSLGYHWEVTIFHANV